MPAIAPATENKRLNVADLLAEIATAMPDATAIACPRRFSPGHSSRMTATSGAEYATATFAELEAESDRLARGLVALGVKPGMRLVLLIRPGIEFVALVFALVRSGATMVLVDPGMGRRHLINCLASVRPEGFIAISPAQAVRTLLRHRFPQAKLNVTVGRRWFWSGPTLPAVRKLGDGIDVELPVTNADDPAAIIFTSGSTGPPKGVLYRHQTFHAQATEIRDHYGIAPGGVDLACFPLFGLFNAAMGMTTVFPPMDFSRPATADPQKLLRAARDWQVTQAFASPAVWDKLSRHCQASSARIETLRRVFSCGAPVPADVLRRTLGCVHPQAEMHTPYGATEALPVASIEAAEVLGLAADRTAQGAGVCVGCKFDTIDWRVIRITDEPIATIDQAQDLPAGEIGELIVRGPQVTREYVECAAGGAECPAESSTGPDNALAKINDGDSLWHRMGDVGYFDDLGRFWYCGRKSQRVVTRHGTLFTIPVEAVFNTVPMIRRTALVGVGRFKSKLPVLVFETEDFQQFVSRAGGADEGDLLQACLEGLQKRGQEFAHTRDIRHFLRHPRLPVDVRHNSKINREQLAHWASKHLPPP